MTAELLLPLQDLHLGELKKINSTIFLMAAKGPGEFLIVVKEPRERIVSYLVRPADTLCPFILFQHENKTVGWDIPNKFYVCGADNSLWWQETDPDKQTIFLAIPDTCNEIDHDKLGISIMVDLYERCEDSCWRYKRLYTLEEIRQGI